LDESEQVKNLGQKDYLNTLYQELKKLFVEKKHRMKE
jgi:hypothetical protein